VYASQAACYNGFMTTSEKSGLPVLRNHRGRPFPTALLDGTERVHLVGYTVTSYLVRHADGGEEWVRGPRVSERRPG
jgi:hypothetical protein